LSFRSDRDFAAWGLPQTGYLAGREDGNYRCPSGVFPYFGDFAEALTASPEGGRLLAQGVSPGTSTPSSYEPRQGRQTLSTT
jgi:hypothetical protein